MAYNEKSYLDKYRGQGDNRSIYDILTLLGEESYHNKIIDDYGNVRREYEALGIDYVLIDGMRFSNYGAYSFIWEKTFVKSPERSQSGALGNLNSHATFLTPHLILDFSVMSIDDYRAIMKMHYERNEFTVECYDPIYNRKVTVKMYFATEEMAKLYTINKARLGADGEWEEWLDLVGVTEYKVEMIGTNNDLDLVSVVYKYNAPIGDNGSPIYPSGSPIPDQAEEDIYLGEEIVVGSNSTFPNTPPSSTWKFKHWITQDGQIYNNGMAITVISNTLILYAVWQPTTSFTLSFNYGLSAPMTEVDSATGVLTEVYDHEITDVTNIGALPTFDTSPYVEDSNTKEKYYPYINGAWYKHPVRQDNLRVYDNQEYWATRDTTIYLLYEKKPFNVYYNSNDYISSIPTQTAYFGDKVYLPTIYRVGYTFDGWYIDPDLATAFDGTMPPYDLYLYAKWVAK